ncbi:MAG: phosphoribosylglycinamide formyltransferase [Mariniphaga sp.]|nr:phosphoribosylglycinamide formyltransferase [Mariniphaga sp.]
MKTKKKIAIFASGSGTNAQNIIEFFENNNYIEVDSVFSNRKDAFVLNRAENYGIPSFIIDRELFYSSNRIVKLLKEREIDLLVLAGFLWLVPKDLIQEFSIINIHPALLPKYGGKGMYGIKVHQEVVENNETESGITIHYVNEVYDEGKTIFQAKCKIERNDSPEDVAAKVHQLEYKYFPKIIKEVLMGNI